MASRGRRRVVANAEKRILNDCVYGMGICPRFNRVLTECDDATRFKRSSWLGSERSKMFSKSRACGQEIDICLG